MNTRPLTKGESVKLSELNEAGLESVLIFLTATGLNKSILDATQPFRELLTAYSLHDYALQPQGPEHKIILPYTMFTGTETTTAKMSLYRPKTKKGDPRFWLQKLSTLANPNDVLAAFVSSGQLFFINLSNNEHLNIEQHTELDSILEIQSMGYNQISDELLFRLNELSKSGPLKAVGTGDTSIGRTIETYLGIDINSSPLPDYKGIEIKSGRTSSKTRSNLFTKVPDWDLSHFKSSKEIVEEIGYKSEGSRRLYCSVSTQKPNSQGLIFDLDLDQNRLNELIKRSGKNMPVAVWRLENLHHKLQEKHRETFWIKAEEIVSNGEKYFSLNSIKHTRRPSNSQFNRLLGTGDITMDHLIKKTEKRTVEKGPIFKISPKVIDELFLGKPKVHSLAAPSS